MARRTKVKVRQPKKDLGGYQVVVLTNGKQYVENFNLCFGIIVLGDNKSRGARVFIKDAVDILNKLRTYPEHKSLYLEDVEG